MLAGLDGSAFVGERLAFGKTKRHLRDTAAVEVDSQRHEGEAFLYDLVIKFTDLSGMGQQFATPKRVVVLRVAELIEGDVTADKPQFIVDDHRVGLLDGGGLLPETFHLCAEQSDPTLNLLENMEAVCGPPIAANCFIGRRLLCHKSIVYSYLEKYRFRYPCG